jgi:hypothetical protein
MSMFSPKFLSAYFVVLPVFVTFWFVIKILRHRIIDKTIQTLDKLPDARKERIIRLYRSAISIERIALWLTPVALVLYLAIFFLFYQFPELITGFPDTEIHGFVLLAGILLVVAFIHFLEDTYYRKKILKAIDKS